MFKIILRHLCCYCLFKGHWLSIWHSVINRWMRKKYWKYSHKLLMLSSTFINTTYFTGLLMLCDKDAVELALGLCKSFSVWYRCYVGNIIDENFCIFFLISVYSLSLGRAW